MGVEKYLLADALLAVIGQRLVRKICPHCKESYNPSQFEKDILTITDERQLFRGRGCGYCNNTGYLNRQVISEIISIDEEKRRSILISNNNADSIGSNKDESLKAQCKDLVMSGITTTEEFIKVCNG